MGKGRGPKAQAQRAGTAAGGRANTTRRPAGPVNRRELAEALPEATAEAAEAVGGAENLPEPAEPPADSDYLAVDRLWRQIDQVKRAYEAATGRAENARHALEEAERDLEDARDGIRAAEKAIGERGRELDERERDIAGREEAGAARTARMTEELRRRLAECGEREEHLAELELRAARQDEEARSKAGAAVRAALADARAELAREGARLDEKRGELRAEERRLKIEREDLEDSRQLVEQRIERSAEQLAEQDRLRLQALQRRHDDMVADYKLLEQRLAAHERLRLALGGREPEHVVADLQRLQEENTTLRGHRPPAEIKAELNRLREAEQRWQEDHAFFMQENSRLQRQLSAYQITAMELERQELVKQALAADVEAYKDEVVRLKENAEGLRRSKESESPFPTCAEMDARHAGERDDLVEELPPIDEFVHRLRHVIAQQERLFYAESDLRIFLAGLAATRLHLLQGASGIGKTQLPLAFAKALQTHAETVPVGADWRTPQDLTGYYNAFERRFYESKFTKALYRANCPEHRSQPFLIVLDEMNLSHPEQYFSDVLHVLELRPRTAGGQIGLDLMTARVEPAPRGLVDGIRLPLPRNVWFIGTANQDETTVGFAEKTLDRSNVIELPAQPEHFEYERTEPFPPFSFRALNRAFAAARKRHERSAHLVRAFLGGDLGDRLRRDFRISTGPRSVKQLSWFVPVVVDAGGTVREAADHALAMKVLRKVRGRYEFRSDTIRALRDDLPKFWAELPAAEGDPDRPIRAVELLNDELHHRGEA
ncbi:AAA family ATPase [Streptosporangium sp. H16]|uniref:AAA family ATPase n=1 Tax=Streptosporangium sp. H16 TaxID=3444184 RepID=UPI003F78C01C